MNDILKNIKAIRRERGFGQEYMAERLGVSQPAYLNWEKGKRDLSYTALMRIADIFEVDVIDIITYPDRYVKESDAARRELVAMLE